MLYCMEKDYRQYTSPGQMHCQSNHPTDWFHSESAGNPPLQTHPEFCLSLPLTALYLLLRITGCHFEHCDLPVSPRVRFLPLSFAQKRYPLHICSVRREASVRQSRPFRPEKPLLLLLQGLWTGSVLFPRRKFLFVPMPVSLPPLWCDLPDIQNHNLRNHNLIPS